MIIRYLDPQGLFPFFYAVTRPPEVHPELDFRVPQVA